MVYGAQKQEKKSQPKKQAQTAQHAAGPAHAAASGKKASTATHQVQSNRNGRAAAAGANTAARNKKNQSSAGLNQRQSGKPSQTSNAANQSHKGKKNQTQAERQRANAVNGGQINGAGRPNQAKRAAAAANNQAAKGKFAKNKPVKPQHFNLSKQPNTAKAPPVKFQQGRRIQGSQNWQGQKYAVFRNYKAEWHDQNWWHNHYHNNFVFVFGAPYYWNAGYWFPAWGYSPNAYYAWDGPIYGYNRMPPDQVIANVQSTLQQQGYYHGEVDGLIGPLTRGAIADYQRDHGLYTTSTIDQPTLQSLGIA
jgi:hypothetical protein